MDLTDIMATPYFDIVDVDLLRLYSLQGAESIVNQMYDNNCIPIYEGVLSHSSTKAAALITLVVGQK